MRRFNGDLRSACGMLIALALGASLSACVIVQAPDDAPASAAISTPPTESNQTEKIGPSPEPPPIPLPPPTSEAPSETPQTQWPEIIGEVRSGVAHLLVTQCEGTGAGTGFLIDDDLVVTAAHVVKDAAEIVLRIDDELVGGQILGTNDRSDVAVVRLDRKSKGHQFTFIEGEPEIGTEIQSLGFPQNLTVKDPSASDSGFTANTGSVTALNQIARYESGSIDNMIRIDTSVDSGNSGGPLINRQGEVVGLVSGVRMTQDKTPVNGWGYAVIAPRVTQAIDSWKSQSTMVDMKSCTDAPAPYDTTVRSYVSSTHDQATNIAQSLVAHGQAINNGNYDAAFSIFTGDIRERVIGLDQWRDGLQSTYWLAVEVEDVTGTGDRLKARVGLVTAQDAAHSPLGTTDQECSIWTMNYTMEWDGTRWLMADVKSVGLSEDCTEDLRHLD